MSSAPLEDTLDRNGAEGRLAAFLSAVNDQQPVAGLTHKFYGYPARFSPVFARAAIDAFSRPGDVILDPFMGGATTLVEARAMGRHAVGSDISTLSVFLSRVKTTPLGEDDLRRVAEWEKQRGHSRMALTCSFRRVGHPEGRAVDVKPAMSANMIGKALP